MYIGLFKTKIENITQLRVAMALQKIHQLHPWIHISLYKNFIEELFKEEGVSEMTELEVQNEFLQYVKEVNEQCLID